MPKLEPFDWAQSIPPEPRPHTISLWRLPGQAYAVCPGTLLSVNWIPGDGPPTGQQDPPAGNCDTMVKSFVSPVKVLDVQVGAAVVGVALFVNVCTRSVEPELK